jgi:hypothetical protein
MGADKVKVGKKSSRSKPYTKGEMNRLIDGLMHPLCEKNTGFIFVDGFLHALIEQNPPESVSKFIRYNLPEILKQIGK